MNENILVFECINCNSKCLVPNYKDGLNCQQCKGIMNPLRVATAKDMETIKKYYEKSTNQRNILVIDVRLNIEKAQEELQNFCDMVKTAEESFVNLGKAMGVNQIDFIKSKRKWYQFWR